ncbi:DUF47 domain-containing protein [Lacrimispora sp. JR3]|uniref:DUF47 domain-containing protein n=1 Tax=Lacrimispora sinapis TaxID=3111456 RepID=UPI00374A071C
MARRSDNDYFTLFVKMADVALQTQKLLTEILADFDPEKLREQLDKLHGLESEGDRHTHELMKRVAKDFVTPIERDDIIALGRELDDITDNIEDVLIKIYMYNIKAITPEAMEMLKVVGQCCEKVSSVVTEFSNFRKSSTILKDIVEINRLEELGDNLYIQAFRKLYTKSGDPLETIAWSEVYKQLEKCCDTCEHAADVIECVIVKNT